MIVETKKERIARGHPVGQDVPYKAMGGLTGFSSLMEGYQRLDESGIGRTSGRQSNVHEGVLAQYMTSFSMQFS